ncbi:hypothetical protein C8R46DRAFT_448066 [Mycena filopes]|nr:hypothetical protein C8R46DRAFT_448066 [Mycena filopes]
MAAPETPSTASPYASPFHSRSPSSSPSTYSHDSSPYTSAYPSTSPSAIEGWSDACLPQILTEELIARGADELQLLAEAREQSSQDTPEHDSYAEHEKKVAENASARKNRYWFSKMKAVFKEMDIQTACIPRKGPLRFLDLGCCPGGFTSYILSKNSSAHGVGISSEIENGGHRFLLEDRHHSRFKINYADLTYYRLGPLAASVASDKFSDSLPFDITKPFDVVLLDGYQLRKSPSAQPGDWDRLLVSQIILGLQATKKDGTVVIKLTDAEQVNTAKLLHMFDILSASLETFKPRYMHATRGTFYAVAKGVGEGRGAAHLPALVDAFQALWVDLTIGGADGTGRALNEDDLDFIISTEDVRQAVNLDRLVDLSRRVWEVQARALLGLRDPPLVSAGMGELDDPFVVRSIPVA